MAAAMSSAPAPQAGVGAAPQIRTIEVADVMDCIAQGVQDFIRAPIYGLFFGAVFAVGDLLLIWASFALNYLYLAYPLVMAFALFAPFGAAGTYEISRRLDSGEPLSWAAVLGANPFLQQRGYAGTHDVGLGVIVLTALKTLRAGSCQRLPVYDRSAFEGLGDRLSRSDWRRWTGLSTWSSWKDGCLASRRLRTCFFLIRVFGSSTIC